MDLTPQDRKAQEKIKSEETKKGYIGCAGILVVLLLIIGLVSSCGSSKDTASKTSPAPPPQKQVYSLGMTPDQFKNKFNQVSSDFGFDLRIGQMEIKDGQQQNSLKYFFNDRLGVIGGINKTDGSLRDVAILGQPSQSSTDNLRILACMGIVMAIVNPELTADQRGELMHDLGFKADADLTKLDNHAIRGNRRYYSTYIKDVGFMVAVYDINDTK